MHINLSSALYNLLTLQNAINRRLPVMVELNGARLSSHVMYVIVCCTMLHSIVYSELK